TESASSEAAAADTVLVDEDLKATLPDFLRSRGELLDEMPAALAAGDRTHFKRCAHRLAGSFALYGFAGAGAECRAIRHAGRDDERVDASTCAREIRASRSGHLRHRHAAARRRRSREKTRERSGHARHPDPVPDGITVAGGGRRGWQGSVRSPGHRQTCAVAG